MIIFNLEQGNNSFSPNVPFCGSMFYFKRYKYVCSMKTNPLQHGKREDMFKEAEIISTLYISECPGLQLR